MNLINCFFFQSTVVDLCKSKRCPKDSQEHKHTALVTNCSGTSEVFGRCCVTVHPNSTTKTIAGYVAKYFIILYTRTFVEYYHCGYMIFYVFLL